MMMTPTSKPMTSYYRFANEFFAGPPPLCCSSLQTTSSFFFFSLFSFFSPASCRSPFHGLYFSYYILKFAITVRITFALKIISHFILSYFARSNFSLKVLKPTSHFAEASYFYIELVY